MFPLQYHKLDEDTHTALVEDPVYFTRVPFHKMKLVLHRASMQKYFLSNGITFYGLPDDVDIYTHITMLEPHDHMVTAAWKKKYGKRLVIIDESPSFLFKRREFAALPPTMKHDSFYKAVRQRFGILVDSKGKPLGGKWSFDVENREPYRAGAPDTPRLPALPPIRKSKYVAEARQYVEKKWPDNPGDTTNFIWPIDRKDALAWLEVFVEKRLAHFGKYEDAILREHPFLFHSLLSSSLNIGLLVDRDVVEALMAKKNTKISIASLEGCIRQVCGWRQYVCWVYHMHGEDLRGMNVLKHKRPVPRALWEFGKTGMPPVDDCLQNIKTYAYTHHICRLMVLGQFMLLCRCRPQEVADWFTAYVSIDAYDVFMVTNVNGMSQYADGGKYMMKRPYISTSKYLMKMGGYHRSDGEVLGMSWADVWDALYYAFIDEHQDILAKNYSMAPHVNRWKKMPSGKKKEILKIASNYHDL